MENNTVVNPQVEQAAQGDAVQDAVQTDKVVTTPDSGVISEAAAPQEKPQSERFAYALKKRVEEESEKIKRETAKAFESDLEFAKKVRGYFQGKADADIENDLREAQVRVFAQEKGISESLAREFLELRLGVQPKQEATKQAEPAQPTSDAWTARLVKQREAIKAKHGVDILDDMTPEEETKVMQGDMDLNELYALRTQRDTPPPVNRGMATLATPKDPSSMSDEEYEQFRKELNRKGQIEYRRE